MTEDTRINRNKIRQFKCKNCGGELQLQNKRSQYVACPYCGSVADSSSEAYKVITKMEKPSKFPPMSFIKIGMEGTFNGKMHHVIGRTRRRNKYKEYWAEGGSRGYSSEVWIFDEWLLISEDATYFTLVEDEEGFTVVTGVTPKYPSMPRSRKMQDFYSGKQKQVQEYGDTEILYYEGESTYLVRAGDKSSFSEYLGDGASYSAEWRYKNGAIKEIEFFQETPISNNELLEAFNLNNQTSAKVSVKRIKNKYIFFVAAILNMILGVGLGFVSNTPEAKVNLVLQDIDIRKLAKNNGWTTINDTLKQVVFRTRLNLKPETKMIDFTYVHVVADSSKCISEVFLTDNNRDTLLRDKQYAYSLRAKENEAFHVVDINEKIIRDTTFNMLAVTIKMQVNKKWNPKNKADREHWIQIKEVNQLYENSTWGAMNFIFGLILFIIGTFWPERW